MKRFAQSDPSPDTNDNAFKSKRIIAGSPFDSNRKEQPSSKETPLDVKRAEESHQHVRALNKQFASWVQLQLQHHPDELWQDGVQDYLTHALGILGKYSDIVAWIKANSAKGESVTSVVSHITENKSIPEVKFPSTSKSSTFGNNTVFGNNSVFGSDKKLVPEAKNSEVKFTGFGIAGSTFGTDNKLVSEAKNNEAKFQPNKNSMFGLAAPTFGSNDKSSEAKNNDVKFQPNKNSMFGQAGSTFGSDNKSPEAKNSEAKFQSAKNSTFGLPGSTFGSDKKSAPEAKNHEVKFQSNNNSVIGLSGSTFGSDKKSAPEAKNTEVKFQPNSNSVFGLSGSTFGSDKKSAPEAKNTEVKFQSNNNSVFGLPGSTFGSDKKSAPEAKNTEVKFQSNSNSVFGLSGSTFGTDKKSGSEAKNTELKFQPNNNSVFGLSGSTFGTDKKSVSEAKNTEVKFQPNNNSVFGLSSTFSQGAEKPEEKKNEAKFSFGQGGSNAGAASPWGSSMMSNSPSPFTFGGSPTPLSVNLQGSTNADADDEVEQPSSPSVKKTEEEGIKIVHEVKCKLYVKSTDPADKDTWKDKGVGQLSIRCKEGVSKATKESKPTIIIRNDVGRVLLNALLYPGIKTNKQKTAIVAIFHTSAETDGDNKVVARTYLLRTKSESDRDKLASAIQEYAPAP